MKYIFTILFLSALSAQAQYKYITFDRTIIRYSAAIDPWPWCMNNNCADIFFNQNRDTLAVVHDDGLVDIRVTVSVKDTLNSVSIIEPNGTLSNIRYLFTGSKAIGFNRNNYYVVDNNGKLPFKIYRVSDNALVCIVGLTMQQWPLGMPLPQTITTNIKRYMLP